MTRKAEIVARALQEGFDAVGVCSPDGALAAGERLKEFIALGRHGDMGWLPEKADRRADPRTLWSGARSVLVVGVNYGPACDPLLQLGEPGRGAISVYAQGADYHDVIKKRLKRLGRWIGERYACELKVFVDTAPVLEKPLAQSSGIGWQGKHTNLVSREFGSWLFLGTIFLAIELGPDAAMTDHCGSCRNCLDICPTAAFPAPYQLDARRCISYLTIEHAGAIPAGLRRALGNRIYGCDDCLAVCPWNKFARKTAEPVFLPRAELDMPVLRELAGLDEAAFRSVFARSAIKRIGRSRFLRNVAIALGNSKDRGAIEPLRRLLDEPSPLVRGAAIWALAQLLSTVEMEGLRAERLVGETDASVRAEWQALTSA